MIQDKRQIQITSSPEIVFDLIASMPNKFPVFKFLETKPFFFLRIFLVDGFSSAIDAVKVSKPDNETILGIGDTMGPFTLTESERPLKYWFTLKSFFMNCKTGYSLCAHDNLTTLNFEIIAEKPTSKEKIYWFLIKHFHIFFASKVLKTIKERVEVD